MHTLLRALAAVSVAGSVVVGSATTAGADPKGLPLDLHCGDTHYSIVTAGNGEFTPAHDLHSNTVFVPLAFGDFTGTLIHVGSGDEVMSFTETGTSWKGNSQARGRTIMECTYTFEDRFIAGPGDEGLTVGEEYVFLGEGEVTGFASGRR